MMTFVIKVNTRYVIYKMLTVTNVNFTRNVKFKQ